VHLFIFSGVIAEVNAKTCGGAGTNTISSNAATVFNIS
jgi:hypothetical protein